MKKIFCVGKYWPGVIALALLMAGIFCLLQPNPVFALNSTPDENVWITNGAVNSIVRFGNTIYLGGSFSYVGPNTGRGVPISATTGNPISPYPKVNNVITAVIPDGSNGWYIGGDFTKVGNVTRNSLAHILSDGTVDPNWHPDANDGVDSLLLNSSGTILYVGGNFSNIDGQIRTQLAALNAITGSVTAWAPALTGSVRAMALDSSNTTLYIGGDFTTIGGQTRNKIGAVNIVTGSSTSWNPSANGISPQVSTIALNSSGTLVYVGGTFTTIGGQSRNRIAALSTITGSSTAWNPNANNEVTSIIFDASNTTMYVGGNFTNIGGQSRNYIAALDPVTGSSTSWNPNAGNRIRSLILNSNATLIYAGGDFTSVGGQSRSKLAAIDTLTGLPTSWSPTVTSSVNALALNSDESVVYIGGLFTTVSAVPRNAIAAIDATTGLATAWDPNANGIVRSLTLNSSGTFIYAGGDFTTIGGQSRNRIAALDTNTGLATTWNPNANSNVRTLTINSNNTTIYAGGDFTTIGGQSKNYIAALNTVTGSSTSWNPNANNIVYAIALDSINNLAYVGGGFTTIGGQSRNRIAALDTSIGSSTSWNPNANNVIFTITLDSSATLAYVGGVFTTIGGQSRNYIAALDTTTGSSTSWNPNANNFVYTIVLDSINNLTYVGGSFTTIGGQTRNRIAAFNTITGLATTWNPNANSTVNVIALNTSGTPLYIGGAFSTIGNDSYSTFAQFSTAGITVSAISGDTTESGGTATFTVVLNSPPTANVTIGISSSDLTEGTVSPSSLTFTTSNWNTPQTVTVTGINDSIIDGNIVYSVILGTSSSSDPNYNGIDAADVSVTNTDNDTAGITVSAISGNTTESGGTATFTVVLDTQPTTDVTISVTSSDATEGTVSPTLLTFTSSNWSTPQTVTVTGVNDSIVDGNIAYSVILGVSSSSDPNYNGIDAADVLVAANTDNEPSGGNNGGLLNITYPSIPTDWIMVSPGLNVTTRNVNFTLRVTNAELMLISENPDFTNDSWQTYSTSKDFTLSAGNGTKTVYFKFRSVDGGDSAVKSVTINLSGQTSDVGITIPEGCATATPGSYPFALSHNFIKLEGLSAIYWLSPDNRRYLFTNRDLFSSWFGDDFSGLKTVSQAEFDAIPFGGNLGVKPGNYIKFDNSPTIYYVRDNNNIYPFTGTPSRVYVIEASFESNYNVNCASPEAAPPYDQIDRDFIKLPTLSAVYWLSPDNVRYLFTNGDTFKSWFDGDFTGLRTVSQAEFDAIPAGVNLTMKPGSYLKFDNSNTIYLVTSENNICKTTATPATIYHVQAGFEIDYNITGNCQ